MSNPIQGSSRILRATFTDEDGNLVDPDVTLSIQDPSGDVTTPTPDNPSTGVFEHELDLDEAGIYRWEFLGTSVNGSEVCAGVICVDASAFAGVS